MKLWKEHKNNASTEEAASAGQAVAQQPRQKKRKAGGHVCSSWKAVKEDIQELFTS